MTKLAEIFDRAVAFGVASKPIAGVNSRNVFLGAPRPWRDFKAHRDLEGGAAAEDRRKTANWLI
jgi:hypothetical protein